MPLQIKESKGFHYVDEGEGEVLMMLHGLFGALSNWKDVVEYFKPKYRVIIPMMPILTNPLKKANLDGLTEFVENFVQMMNLDTFTLVGNSLGGHIGLIYTIRNLSKVNRLVLTGSSGLFEHGMGGSFPKRGSKEYIEERVAYTFYDPKVATEELVDEVFEVTNDRGKCLRIIYVARSAQRHNMAKDLHQITIPVLLVWGLNDTITPPIVAHDFARYLPDARLRFIDQCCHAPMMEQSKIFNAYFEEFMAKTANAI